MSMCCVLEQDTFILGRERSGSKVECLTRGVAGSSLIGIYSMCCVLEQDTFILA